MQLLVERSQPYFRYGLLFWLDSALFSARGWGGQYIVVFPAKHLIAVRTKDPGSIDLEKLPKQAFRDFRQLVSQWE